MTYLEPRVYENCQDYMTGWASWPALMDCFDVYLKEVDPDGSIVKEVIAWNQ